MFVSERFLKQRRELIKECAERMERRRSGKTTNPLYHAELNPAVDSDVITGGYEDDLLFLTQQEKELCGIL